MWRLSILFVWLLVITISHAKDPDQGLNMSQIVPKYGYPIEKHSVTTEDGYILGVFRIPYGKKSPPTSTPKPIVFLQHGLEDSSWDWVSNFPNESLGYILADNGYDVWFGNTRGNYYSRGHASLPPDSIAYWNFTVDDHILRDLPAMIDFVLNATQQEKLAYIGHSQGTVMGFAGFSANQELGAKIKVFVAVAPIAYAGHITCKLMVDLSKIGDDQLLYYLDKKAFTPDPGLFQKIDPTICADFPNGCVDFFEMIMGKTKNLNATRMPVYTAFIPAGTSSLNVVHWAQWIRQDKFQMFDYETKARNMEHYGQPHPPQYNLSAVNVNTVLYTGTFDSWADATDVEQILKQMPPGRIVRHVNFDTFAHWDYVIAPIASQIMYPDLLGQLKKYQ